MSPWSRLPLKGSKEYNALVSLTGLAIGLVWVAKSEYENPKWTGIPKASRMSSDDLGEWNKQFGPSDLSKWAIPRSENEQILQSLDSKFSPPDDSVSLKKQSTW
jgi:hypothetical protein